MRLPWQCPTCYAELGDKSYAEMLTCPYCGTLLIVDAYHKKFLRVPKNGGWYYFSEINSPGYIKFGEYEEHYRYYQGKWYLLKDGILYELKGESRYKGYIIEEGKVTYIWGEIPFIAPPGIVLKTAVHKDLLLKITSRVVLLFLQSPQKSRDIFPEVLEC